MARESEQLEQEADQARAQLSSTLEDLRARMTPGQVVDSILDYARGAPGAEFLSNLGREIRENPLPLLLIGIGIAWLMVASSRSARSILSSTADSAAKRTGAIGAVTTRVVNRTSELGQQTAAQVVDGVSDVASRVASSAGGATEAVTHKSASTTAITTDASRTRATGGSEPASACDGAEDRANQRGLIAESIALSNEEMQRERHWEHAGATELDHERR